MKTKIIAYSILLTALIGFMGVSSVSAETLKERDAKARAKYQEAWGQFQREVNFMKQAREEFFSARTKYQQLKNTANKKLYEDGAKKFLEKTINSLIRKLEVLKNWVSNRRALSETDQQAIIAEIDKDINWLKEKAAKIDTATPEQIKEEAKIIREYWRIHRLKVKKIIGQIWAARINFVITKAETFAEKVKVKIEELKAAGKDTAQLEAWLMEFNQKIVLAKEKVEAAKAKFQEIKSEIGADFTNELKAADDLFKVGHNFIKEANQYIRDAHKKLVQIVNEMKKMGKAVETPTE